MKILNYLIQNLCFWYFHNTCQLFDKSRHSLSAYVFIVLFGDCFRTVLFFKMRKWTINFALACNQPTLLHQMDDNNYGTTALHKASVLLVFLAQYVFSQFFKKWYQMFKKAQKPVNSNFCAQNTFVSLSIWWDKQ